MFRRFCLGLIEGLGIGVGFAIASVRGFGLAIPSSAVSALLAAAVGCLVGLVAGRPVWTKGTKIEALLKAGAGALVGAGLSLALGKWLTTPVDLRDFALGLGPAGKLSALSLPAIACALALFFELDDTTSGALRRAGSGDAKRRLDAPPNEQHEQHEQHELDEFDTEAKRRFEKH